MSILGTICSARMMIWQGDEAFASYGAKTNALLLTIVGL